MGNTLSNNNYALARNILYSGNVLWHFLAAYYFIFKGKGILRKYSLERSPTPMNTDVLKFLGAFNLSMVVLGGLRLYAINYRKETNEERKGQDFNALLTLATANCSQFVLDLIMDRTGRWNFGYLNIITVFDGLFTVLDLYYVLKHNK
jgi:hypothetical protein